MKKFTALVFGLLVISLVGCVAQPTLTPPNSQEPVVVYHRSGGFAGFDETWTIYGDGQIDHAGRGAGTAGQLTADRMQQLLATLRAIDLSLIKDSYIGKNTCCDRFIYEITITFDGQTKMIQTIDAAEGEPAALIKLQAALQEVLR